jgi:competence protein ComEC
MTLLATPLVALAIPGILVTLILSLAHPGPALFLAAGVESTLELLLKLVHLGAALPFASIWVSHTTVLAACVAFVCGVLLLSSGSVPGGIRRRPFLAWSVIAGILLGPPSARILTLGVLELVILDVGQGDAALLRSPGGRWVLVDAGPRTETFDAGKRTVLPYLRKRGVQALELMVLTHPDMDHVGGASSVLREFQVRSVLDPGKAAGTHVFIDALRAAQEAGVPWRVAEAGDSLNLDGMALRVLAPEEGAEIPALEGSNGASLVLEVRYGAFSAVFAGDAPATSEERFIPRIFASEIQVLKVGHHGSSTSTTTELLARTSPETALISVGRRNRFGHPDRAVLNRLEKEGARVLRTDLNGILVVRARRDGSYRVSVQHR